MRKDQRNEMNKLSVIVAIYKNEMNIIPFYEDFKANIAPYIDDYEIIMVNDDSPDNSWDIMLDLAKKDKKIKIIKLARNFGAICASFTGISLSTGDCVTVRACDLQEPASLIIDMYNEWKKGAKTVIAVRESREDPFTSKIFSNIYYRLVRLMVNKSMPLSGFDTYLIDRNVANMVIDMNDRNSPITIQLLWLGIDIHQVSYTRKKRKIGKSSWTFSKKMKLFLDTFMGFSYVPIRLMSGFGIIFAIIAVIITGKAIIDRLIGLTEIKGYTPIFAVVLFSSGMIMFSLGVLGEYLWRTFDSTRNLPMTVISEKVNFDE